MKKYNILFVSATSEIGGADLALLDIVRRISKDKFYPVVVMPFKGPLVDDFKKSGAEVILCNTGYIRRHLNPIKVLLNIFQVIISVPRLLAVIKRKQINLVHSNSSIVFGGALAAKLSGVRHVWHVREVKVRPRLVTAIIKWLMFHTSDKIIAISQAVKESFPISKSYQDKIFVLFDGVDLDVFFPRKEDLKLKAGLGIPPEAGVVAATGLILPLKGYEYFLEAASLVIRKIPDTFFLIVGDTVISRHDKYKAGLKNLAERLDIADKVVFTGMRPDIADILSLSNISVLSSVEPEGLGRVIPESMALGKPVITTDIGGQAEAVSHKVDGILVPPKDPVALSEAILLLLNDPELGRSLGQAGQRKVEKYFNLKENILILEKLFEGLC